MNTDKTFYEAAMAEAVSFVAAGCFAPSALPAISEADAKRLAEAWPDPAFYNAATAKAELVVTGRGVAHGDRARFDAALGPDANGESEERDRLALGVRPETD